MGTIRLTGRSSRLSLLQMELVRDKIIHAFPGTTVEILAGSSLGDALQHVPLHTVEGSDFFTREIFDALEKGYADIAVHSLKDMSSEHFFGTNVFAVVDRDDTRDVAIFNPGVTEKIRNGETIVVGTCSPRRELMATEFLKRALPQGKKTLTITTEDIRGNVDTRLQKLDSGAYDAIILATAGINRLLRSNEDAPRIRELLQHKKLMLLPLIECVPAPCQGAIVAEAHSSNKQAVEILKRINDEKLYNDCVAEKKEAVKYGSGCLQKFGVTTLTALTNEHLYAAGRDAEGTVFTKWSNLPDISLTGEILFSSTDLMKEFFEYEWSAAPVNTDKPVVFVANYKALQKENAAVALQHKTIVAAGTKTWFELSKQGYWVTAGADALGFEFLLPSLQMPLLNISPDDICVLTNVAAAARWKQKGYDAVSNYKLVSKENAVVLEQLRNATIIFWSSFSQYEYYGQYAKHGARHACAGGETAALLAASGVQPIIFPTIKSFQQWRATSIPSHNAA